VRRAVLAVAAALLAAAPAPAQDPLPSWNDGASKKAIVDFVGRVTREGSPDFVAAADRDRRVRQRRYAVVRAADLLPVRVCPTPSISGSHRRSIPPEQVVGTTFVTKFAVAPNGMPTLTIQPRLQLLDDGPGKPAGIYTLIGRRPILAFGNSDGDQQMLEWTNAKAGARLMGLVHHTDSTRERSYDRQSHIGKLDKALDESIAKQWVVVNMKSDWKVIYPFQR